MQTLCILSVVLYTVYGFRVSEDPPAWPASYQVEGRLQLPYAELDEPFMAYYDGAGKRSRVDYYDGMVKTFLRADMKPYGVGFEIVPMTTYKVTNQMSCFLTNGTSDAPVDISSILPDLSGFEKIGSGIVETQKCDMWRMINEVTGKKNTYTMYVDSSTGEPIKYEMYGYDSLLGSHYDKYYVLYKNFKANPKFSDDTFSAPPGMKCGDFPGPGFHEKHVLMNPMKEYVHHYDQHIPEMFAKFKVTHNKQYKDDVEHAKRKHQFRHNVRYIHSKNRAGLKFRLAVNHLADKTDTELKMMNGFRRTPGHHGGLPDPYQSLKHNLKAQDVPDSWDWRLYGAVTQVKDQAVCGSCWSFGTTGVIEGAYFMKFGKRVRLSQQELMDCSWGEGNNACDGGEDFRSYNWIKNNGGLTSEENYGPYLAQDGMCHAKNATSVVQLKDYVNVTKGDLSALKFAIAKQGPVSVAIDASHKSLSFYSSGLYYEPKCGNTDDDLDHAVLAVGYGTIGQDSYWLVKNSWSTYWGDDGFVLMSQKDNNCGVATAATYVILQ